MFERDVENLTDSVKAAIQKKKDQRSSGEHRSSTSMAERSSAEHKDDAKLRSQSALAGPAPAPHPDSYSKPLQTQIRYIQYVPKEAHDGTLEEAFIHL